MSNVLDIPVILGTGLRDKIDLPEEIKIMVDGEKPKEGFAVFRILDPLKGDERLTWDANSLADIQAAKKTFLSLLKRGLKPFKVSLDGKQTSEVMDEFDPAAEEVLFVPFAMVAGG